MVIVLENSKLIVDRINELCNKRGITVGKLCTISGSNGSTINDIMNGVTKNPGVFTIQKLCDGLDITLCDFFDTASFKNSDQVIK